MYTHTIPYTHTDTDTDTDTEIGAYIYIYIYIYICCYIDFGQYVVCKTSQKATRQQHKARQDKTTRCSRFACLVKMEHIASIILSTVVCLVLSCQNRASVILSQIHTVFSSSLPLYAVAVEREPVVKARTPFESTLCNTLATADSSEGAERERTNDFTRFLFRVEAVVVFTRQEWAPRGCWAGGGGRKGI
jgi:hypothetical protein